MKIRIDGQKMNKWQYASNKQCISIVTQFLHVAFYIIWVKSIGRLIKKNPTISIFLLVQHASTCVSSYTGCKQTHRHTVYETSIQSSLFSCTDIEIGGLII